LADALADQPHVLDQLAGFLALPLQLTDELGGAVSFRLELVDLAQGCPPLFVERQDAVHGPGELGVTLGQRPANGFRLLSDPTELQHYLGGTRRRSLHTGLVTSRKVMVPSATSMLTGSIFAK
jgi:hypothetical protein